MKFDFKTAFKAAKVPALAMIALSVIVAILAFLGLNIGIISIPAQFAILAYAGYNGVKAFKLDIANGALAGAVASFLSMVFTLAMANAQYFLDNGYQKALAAQNGMAGETVTFYMFVGFLVMLIFSPVIGAIFGAIGAYFAKKK